MQMRHKWPPKSASGIQLSDICRNSGAFHGCIDLQHSFHVPHLQPYCIVLHHCTWPTEYSVNIHMGIKGGVLNVTVNYNPLSTGTTL
jgi:hypothetical protein